MIFRIALCLLFLFGITPASADVWKWLDAAGNTHYVDTLTPIYTWVDDFGKIHYSDTPDHEDAVSVEFVWHSAGILADVNESDEDAEFAEDAFVAESPEERAAREAENAAYCDRVSEIYDAYTTAPQLYRTKKNGKREILSEREAAKILAETRARKEEACLGKPGGT